jgi:hypothetical protein
MESGGKRRGIEHIFYSSMVFGRWREEMAIFEGFGEGENSQEEIERLLKKVKASTCFSLKSFDR